MIGFFAKPEPISAYHDTLIYITHNIRIRKSTTGSTWMGGLMSLTILAGRKSLVANRADEGPILFLQVLSYDMGS